MRKAAYLFPGQGAQYVGMGRDLYDKSPESKSIFDKAEEVLPGLDIKKLCFEGPIEELTRTANSQVAILVVSIAALEAFGMRVNNKWEIAGCAGLSLGELSALVASGSLRFPEALRLVRRRGELMEEASIKNPGGMASVIGLGLKDLEEACNQTGAEIANLNCPGQTVISGTKESVDACMKLVTEKGAKKAIALNVSGPFHSSLMKEAAGLFKIELDKVNFSNPAAGFISNVSAEYETKSEEIKNNLFKQLYSPVRWEDCIRRIASDGVDAFFEIGPGKVLKGLARRIDANLKVYNIEKMEDIIALEKSL